VLVRGECGQGGTYDILSLVRVVPLAEAFRHWGFEEAVHGCFAAEFEGDGFG